jgi:hypothetical protein
LKAPALGEEEITVYGRKLADRALGGDIDEITNQEISEEIIGKSAGLRGEKF